MSGVWGWLTDPAHWSGPNGIPVRLGEHVVISAWAVLLALVVALPLAAWTGHTGRGGAAVSGIGTVGRAVPTYAVIVTFALWDPVGVGGLAVVLGLAVFAVPPLLVNGHVAMREVEPDVRDAARGMGMTGGQLLRKVEVPLAFPLAFAGIRSTSVQVVATATFGALVGAGTLGQYVVEGFNNQDYAELYSGVVLVAALCVGLEAALGVVDRAVRRRSGRPAAS